MQLSSNRNYCPYYIAYHSTQEYKTRTWSTKHKIIKIRKFLLHPHEKQFTMYAYASGIT